MRSRLEWLLNRLGVEVACEAMGLSFQPSVAAFRAAYSSVQRADTREILRELAVGSPDRSMGKALADVDGPLAIPHGVVPYLFAAGLIVGVHVRARGGAMSMAGVSLLLPRGNGSARGVRQARLNEERPK